MRDALDELSPLQIRRTRIRQEIARLGVNIMVLDRYENELRQFERRVVLDERNYEAFMEKSEAARVLEELDRQKMINLTVIEAASPPISSSNLSKKLRVVLGAFVGLFYGAIYGFIAGWMFAYVRNAMTGFYVNLLRRRAEAERLKDFLNYI